MAPCNRPEDMSHSSPSLPFPPGPDPDNRLDKSIPASWLEGLRPPAGRVYASERAGLAAGSETDPDRCSPGSKFMVFISDHHVELASVGSSDQPLFKGAVFE
jgi:hypothetical protein